MIAPSSDVAVVESLVKWVIPLAMALVALVTWVASVVTDRKLNRHNDSGTSHAALLLQIDEKLSAIGREDERAHREIGDGLGGLRGDITALVQELAGRRDAKLGGRDYNDRRDS